MTDGEVLKIIRSMKGYSQDGAGKSIDLSQQSFSKWERKEEIPPARLKRLLGSLNSTKDEFDKIKGYFTTPPPPHTG